MADRPRHRLPSARLQVLSWCVLLLSLALLVSVLVTRTALDRHVNVQIDAELRHEVDEVRELAARDTDQAGQPLSGVAGVVWAAVAGAEPEPNGTLVGYLDGRAAVRSSQQPLLRLDTDPHLRALWSGSTRTRLGTVSTSAGPVRYVAVPVVRAGDPRRGVVVAAVFVNPDKQVVRDVTRIMTETGLAALAMGFALAWVVAGRILAPIRQVTDLARTIGETDLTSRIPVAGNDEVGRLISTFNDMLDRLQRAFRMQREFVGDAGHELRTPLTIIRGNLELLATVDDDPQERRETLAIVTDELDRMTRMVNDLLTLATSGQPDFLQVETVDLARLTAELAGKVAALADRDWQVETVGHGTVLADRHRLSQAVLQLAQNAVQHTQPGATIFLGSALADGWAQLWVRDTGPGVALPDQRRIFSRFARGGLPRTGDGAGLGLAIVGSIAEAHGGSLRVDSPTGAGPPGEGRGATFTILLSRGCEQERPCPGS